MTHLSYRRHRFPPPIIQQAIWLYLRFTLSYRDAPDLGTPYSPTHSLDLSDRDGRHQAIVRGDARQLAYDTEFDVVLSLCQGGFGLVGDEDGAVLDGIGRAAKSGGRVVFSAFSAYFLLQHLEDVHIASDRNLIDVRFPVQYVIRPHSAAHQDQPVDGVAVSARGQEVPRAV